VDFSRDVDINSFATAGVTGSDPDGGTAYGVADVTNTAFVSALSFTDASGNPINVNYTSASGFVYAMAPVPEPTSYALLLCGLVVISVTAKRSNKRM
jgi:hypothetical protein